MEGTEDSSLLLQRAAAAVLAALPASELGAYVDAQIRGPVSADQPDHLTFLLCQGDQPGPQACWRLLLDMHMDNRQQQSLHRRFVATLHLLAANNDAAAPREASKGAVLALLLHGLDHALAAAAHPGRIRRCMELLLEASAAHGPAFWAADGASARAALVLLHDRVLPVLAASIDSSNDDTEWQDGQDALLLVVRVASAALLHAPPAVDLPFLPLVSRLLLLLGPRGGDRGSSSAPSPPGIVAAALALFNQLLALGRLPPDATRA